MKALVKSQKREGLWLEEVPIPSIGDNDVLIKIEKTAICGTDMHIYQWDEWAASVVPVPLVIGHEFYGVIEAAGIAVEGLKVGQRVSGEGHITCGHCRNCRAGKRHLCPNTLGTGGTRPGCFAEYLSLPATNVIVLPDNIKDNIASILDPLGNAMHCALSFDVSGEDVLITGAGPIGIMATAIVRHIGARQVVVTDVNDHHLALAKTMGATRTVNVLHESLDDVKNELGIEEGFSVGFEMSGQASALNDMIDAMSHGGHIALLGILPNVAIDWSKLIFKGLFLKGIYGREMFETWHKMIAMLQSGLNIEPVITHEFRADDFEEAFQLIKSGQAGKVLLNWSIK